MSVKDISQKNKKKLFPFALAQCLFVICVTYVTSLNIKARAYIEILLFKVTYTCMDAV